MTLQVTFPNIAESTKRVLAEFFGTYFSGGTFTVAGNDLEFPACNVVFDLKYLDTKFNNPVIVIQFVDAKKEFENKCNNPNFPGDSKKFGFERWSYLRFVFTAAVPIDESNPNKNLLMVDTIWSCIAALVLAKRADLSARNIPEVEIQSIPRQLPSTKFAAVTGDVEVVTNVQYAVDPLSA